MRARSFVAAAAVVFAMAASDAPVARAATPRPLAIATPPAEPALAAPGSPAAAPGSGNRVGAVVFFSAGMSDSDLTSMLAVLGSELVRRGRTARVGKDADERLPDAGLPDYCADSPPCLREVAGRLEVDRIVLLLLTAGGGRLRLESIVADGPSGRLFYRARREMKLDTTTLARAATELADLVVSPPRGKLRVTTTLRGADVLVNGSLVGTVPLAGPLEVAPGEVTVTVRRDKTAFSSTVWVEGGMEREAMLGVEEARRHPASSPWLWAPIGLALGLVGGIVIGLFVVAPAVR